MQPTAVWAFSVIGPVLSTEFGHNFVEAPPRYWRRISESSLITAAISAHVCAQTVLGNLGCTDRLYVSLILT